MGELLYLDESWDDAAPRPDALIESLRSFGYSPESAVADLVDNSISADARVINLHFGWEGIDSHMAIVDNGRGMDDATLVQAMRLGSLSPLAPRKPKDLGRFGLGLKTASFSQAREVRLEGARFDRDNLLHPTMLSLACRRSACREGEPRP